MDYLNLYIKIGVRNFFYKSNYWCQFISGTEGQWETLNKINHLFSAGNRKILIKNCDSFIFHSFHKNPSQYYPEKYNLIISEIR